MPFVDAVCDWLNEQPLWQQDLARRLTESVDLDPAEMAIVLGLVCAAHGLAASTELPLPQRFRRDHLLSADGGPAPRLLAFGHLTGVGLVVDDGELTFGREGLTIIYGQNAAGKSSYVRGLKILCRTVDQGCRIRGDIYSSQPESPSAKLDLEIDGKVTSRCTPLSGSAVERIPGLSVFDSACAELYVDTRNVIQYIPPELLLLSRMGSAQDALRKLVDSEQALLRTAAPSFDDFPPGTQVKAALDRLSGTSTDPDLEQLATLGEAEMAELSRTRAAVAASDASTGRADALAAQGDARNAARLADCLTELVGRADSEAARRLQDAATANLTAQEALKLANEEFAAAPVAGIGNSAWRVLWQAARDFAAGEAAFPPAAAQPCPLCLQPLSAEAAQRMAHFEQHVKSAVQNQADLAAASLAAALAYCDPAHAAACKTDFLTGMQQREPELAADVHRAIAALEAHLQLMNASPSTAVASPDVHTAAADALRAWARTRSAHAETLLSADDPAQLAKMRGELAELDARQLLHQRLVQVHEWQDSLRRVRTLDKVRTALATNKINIKQRQLAESKLSENLKKSLAVELANMQCDDLPVEIEMQTAQAQPTVGLRLLSSQAARLSDIASEGEQRAVALAFFFAELETLEDDAGIIVDDPVSSLDDERRSYIAGRLTDEARRRQVIIFTHDLPFVVDLQGQAHEKNLALHVQGVWRLGKQVGRVDPQPPFKVMNLKQRIGQLKVRAAQWDSQAAPASYDEAWRRVCSFYNDLRTSWERAVEERLFRGVVQRFQRAVKTQSLKDVSITPELIRDIDAGMSRASMFVHDEPPAGSGPLPGRAQLEDDLAHLVEFEKATK